MQYILLPEGTFFAGQCCKLLTAYAHDKRVWTARRFHHVAMKQYVPPLQWSTVCANTSRVNLCFMACNFFFFWQYWLTKRDDSLWEMLAREMNNSVPFTEWLNYRPLSVRKVIQLKENEWSELILQDWEGSGACIKDLSWTDGMNFNA